MATVSDQLYSLMALAAAKTASLRPHASGSSSGSSYDGDDRHHSSQGRYDSNHSHQHNDSNSSSNNLDEEFHLTIPDILTQSGGGLSRMNQQVLAECMEPVVKSLRALDAESLLNLERVENGARLCDGVNVRPIHDEVYPQYDTGGGAMSFVRYVHITEIPEQYSIGIFVFPPFSRIPLHDHPEMCVLSRLLYGDLQCLSLDLPDDATAAAQEHDRMSGSGSGNTQAGQPSGQNQSQAAYQQQQHQNSHYNHHNNMMGGGAGNPPATSLPPGLPPGSRRAYKNPIRHLHAPDVSLLFPYKGNLHEFYAGPNGAAVLDILLPPYDVEHDRDCTFYDIAEDPVAAAAACGSRSRQQQRQQPMMVNGSMMMMTEPSTSMAMLGREESAEEERIPCWIVPTQQPHDFHCLSGKYQKLGANVISMQDS